VKEEEGFLCNEMKETTPLGYYPGILAVEQCFCSSSDSIKVLPRLGGSEETPNMKNYTLKI